MLEILRKLIERSTLLWQGTLIAVLGSLHDRAKSLDESLFLGGIVGWLSASVSRLCLIGHVVASMRLVDVDENLPPAAPL